MADPVLPVEWREQIVSSFERRLHELGSPIVDKGDSRDQMLAQARSILDEVAGLRDGVSENSDAISLSLDIGASRAASGVHPVESLRAAAVLFDIAFPFVFKAFGAAGSPDAASSAALSLHRVIMSRIASSSVSYVGFLLNKLHDSHRAERARLSRDLHDRAAHAVRVALQNLELYEVYADRDVARAQDRLRRARDAVRQAMDIIQRFSLELRTTLRPDGLENAITDYLAANASNEVVTNVKVDGDTATVPVEICEEVYIVLREAMRNALAHSGATRIDVTVEIGEFALAARVCDTGRGFAVDEVARSNDGIGLSSMRERMQLLGGTFGLSSRPGEGTTATITVPLPRGLL